MVIVCVPRQALEEVGYEVVMSTCSPGASDSLLKPRSIWVPQGSTAVNVTVVFRLRLELFMTTPVTLAHSPARTVVGFTLIYMSALAFTGIGTKTRARHVSVKKLLIRWFLIDLSFRL
jgi:hypothetical protein